MKKYIVTVYEVHKGTIEVIAKDENSAREKAETAIVNNEEIEVIYDHTLDKEKWDVEEKYLHTDALDVDKDIERKHGIES